MKYVCKNCGRIFEGKPSAKRVYCSKQCHDAAQNRKVKVTCATCGKEFLVPPSKAKWKNNFCCEEHRRKWLSEIRIKELNVPGHSRGHKAPHLTELNETRNPKVGLAPKEIRGNYVSKQHRKIAEQMLGRKLKPTEDVHHINGIRDDNRPENLAVIDHREHLKLHWKLAKERGVI